MVLRWIVDFEESSHWFRALVLMADLRQLFVFETWDLRVDIARGADYLHLIPWHSIPFHCFLDKRQIHCTTALRFYIQIVEMLWWFQRVFCLLWRGSLWILFQFIEVLQCPCSFADYHRLWCFILVEGDFVVHLVFRLTVFRMDLRSFVVDGRFIVIFCDFSVPCTGLRLPWHRLYPNSPNCEDLVLKKCACWGSPTLKKTCFQNRNKPPTYSRS